MFVTFSKNALSYSCYMKIRFNHNTCTDLRSIFAMFVDGGTFYIVDCCSLDFGRALMMPYIEMDQDWLCILELCIVFVTLSLNFQPNGKFVTMCKRIYRVIQQGAEWADQIIFKKRSHFTIHLKYFRLTDRFLPELWNSLSSLQTLVLFSRSLIPWILFRVSPIPEAQTWDPGQFFIYPSATSGNTWIKGFNKIQKGISEMLSDSGMFGTIHHTKLSQGRPNMNLYLCTHNEIWQRTTQTDRGVTLCCWRGA